MHTSKKTSGYLLHATRGDAALIPSLQDVQEYLKSIDLQCVTPASLRDVFNLNKKEYHSLRTRLARWSKKGFIDNPSKGIYRANPEYSSWNEIMKKIPPEHTKYHNFQMVGTIPKKKRKGAWGGSATISNFGHRLIPLSMGGNCKITRHRNGTLIYQTGNSKEPWDLPKVFKFFGWVERDIEPYEPWEIDLRIKQVDIHIDSEWIQLAPATAMKFGHAERFYLQIYNKKPLGVTRIEFPAKMNMSPGQFLDAYMGIGGELY